MATIKNVNDYYIRSDGSYTEDTNNSGVFYPNSNYSNLLRIYLEDGITDNTFVQVNFLIDGKYVTEWLPLFLGSETTKTLNDTLVTFTEFKMLVPGTVLQNASPNETKTIGLSVRMVYTDSWDGVYTDYDELDAEYDLTGDAEDPETYDSLGEEMADNYALAYCVQDTVTDDKGFYQVQLNAVTEVYEWTAVELPDSYAETKGYAVGTATLQKGFVNPKGTITTSELVTNAIFVELSSIEQDVSTNTTAIANLDTNKLEKDFTEYTEKTTYSSGDYVAVNDNEDTPAGTPKHVELSNIMKSENVSFDNSATAGMESDDVKEAIEELETDIITEKDKIDAHIADTENPHEVTATQTTFTPTVNPTLNSENVQDAIEEVQTNVESNDSDISDLLDGTQIAKKAEQDDEGNDIVATYATKAENLSGNATLALAKVDKDLSSYNVATLADSQVIYVQDGSNYRKATIGAVKTYIASDFVSFGYVIATADVDGLPDVSEPLTNKIYLVLVSEPDEDNLYNEFVYVDSSWELIGTTAVDLSDYLTETEITALISDMASVKTLTSITTEPVSPSDGDLYFNSTDSLIYEYQTDTWVSLGSPQNNTFYTFSGVNYVWDGSDLVALTSVDLSDYLTETQINTLLTGYIEADGTNSAIDELTFVDNESETELAEGKVRYNNGNWEAGLETGTLDIGREIYQKIKATGSAINDGRPYYLSGSTGENPLAYLADRNDYPHIMGLATEDISENAVGRGTVFGYVRGVDTTGTLSDGLAETWTSGDVLWLTDTAGQLTNVEPSNGAIKVKVGKVIYAHATEGIISVCIDVHLPHNEVAGIQGGTTDEYYHLTLAQVTKLTNIEENAEVNTIEGVIVDSTELTPDVDKNVTIPDATTTVKGVTQLSDATDSSGLGTTDHVITETVLDAILPEKVDANTAITGATKAKITYDSKGLVTAGDDLSASDIPTLEQSKITDLEDDLADKAEKYPATNTEDANYTLVLADDGKLILAGHATNAVKITIPLNSSVAFPTNTEIAVMKYLAGTVTIGTASGATLNGESSATTFEIENQYESVAIKKVGTDAWVMVGNFSEVV